MLARVPAYLVNERYPDLVAELLAPVRGRKPLDPHRINWAFEYAPTLSAGCVANMLGRVEASARYHALSEEEQLQDFAFNCTVRLVARQGQRTRQSDPLPCVPSEVLDAHLRHVRMEAEWRVRSGRVTTSQTPVTGAVARSL